MNDKFENELIKAISSVPGLVGLANTNFSKSPVVLSKSSLNDGLSLVKTSFGTNVIASIIVVSNIRAKTIISEILLAIKNVFKKNNIKLNNINVYVRGIK